MGKDVEKTVEQRKSLRVKKIEELKDKKGESDNKKKPDEVEEMSSEEDEGQDFSADEGSSEESFGPESLGLHRVGTQPKRKKLAPALNLNKRGVPARLRKRNPLIYHDNVVTDKKEMKQLTPKKSVAKPSPAKRIKRPTDDVETSSSAQTKKAKREENFAPGKRGPKGSAKKIEPHNFADSNIVRVDKRIGQKIGMRLRNLLKLPKAHKFVSYEWFYSTIDNAILNGENDFQVCLRESFPSLITRQLTRPEWNRVRKTLGKPRRCSQAFFEEERRELERRRQKIRLLQARKAGDPSFVRDLPNEIPLPLVVGTKVTARLRSPQDGLFTGTVEAVDPLTNSYRINFDRPGLGSYSIPDYEVAANEQPSTLNLCTITQNFRPRRDVALYMISPLRKVGPLASIGRHDPLLGGDSYPKLPKPRPLTLPKDQLNGYSIKLLEILVRTKKLLQVKQSKLNALKKMNQEVDKNRTKNEPISDDFQKKYAYHVIGMEKLNRDIADYLSQLQTCCKELSTDPKTLAMLAPCSMRQKCKDQAEQTIEKNLSETIQDNSILNLITGLTTVMWVTSYLSNNDQYDSIVNVLGTALHEVKCSVNPNNQDIFEKNVAQHVNEIQIGLHKKAQQAKLEALNRPKVKREPRPVKKETATTEDIIINTPDTVEPIQIDEAQAEAINRSAEAAENQERLEDAIDQAQNEFEGFDEYPVKSEKHGNDDEEEIEDYDDELDEENGDGNIKQEDVSDEDEYEVEADDGIKDESFREEEDAGEAETILSL